MFQGISRQSFLTVLIGALLICFTCVFACPATAHAESVAGKEGVSTGASFPNDSDANASPAKVDPGAGEKSSVEGSGRVNGVQDQEAGGVENLNQSAQIAADGSDDAASRVEGQKSKTGQSPAAEQMPQIMGQKESVQIEAQGAEEDGDSLVAMLSAAQVSAPLLSAQAGPFVIVIDPGHGGYDSGANSYVVEKDVNLAIASYLSSELKQYTNVKVYMTRSDDTFVSLGDRVSMAIGWGANVVVSIHNNAGGGRGAEVIVPNSSSWYYSACYSQGQELGNNILNELRGIGLGVHQGVYSKDTTNNSRYPDGSVSDYFTLVEGPREYGVLGIIVEHAFVDTASDAAFLQGDANLRKLALADARGIARTYGLTKVDLSNVHYDAPLAAGTYVIATANNGNQVLDVANGSSANGANVLLWESHNGAWQKWDVTYDSQGLYTFKNVGTKNVIDVAGANAFSGTNILTWQGRSSDYYNQRFVVVQSGDGYIIKSVLNTAYVLDCSGGKWANGTNVTLWSAHGGNNQKWYFINLNPQVAFGKTVEDGVYTLGASGKRTQLIEVQGASRANGGNVDLCVTNGASNQRWLFQYNGAGYYKIVNQNSGLVLDVGASRVTAGANVLQWQWNGTKNQLWGIRDNGDGTHSIFSALNGMPLDVHGGSTANYANIEIYYYHGGANQRYALTKATNNDSADSGSIMGASTVSVAQMVKYYATTGAAYPSWAYASKGAATIDQFAQIALEEANVEGVRAEVLFAQAMLETGNLRFGGDVSPDQCNFGGIGATGGGVKGNVFSDVRQGLRAQVQHLKAYASTAPLNNACVDPRFYYVTRGSAPTVQLLSGKWAGDPSYGDKIITIINAIKRQ